MATGDFEQAWRISDAVLARRDPSTRDDPTMPYHSRWVWDGRSFENKQILVRCYHGLGDTLQFCRFLRPLRRRARHLTLEVQPELLDLLRTLLGPDRLHPFRPDRPSPPSECDLEIMELSHALRQPPTPRPYLPIPKPAQEPRIRVGLCWQANAWLPDRSLPAQHLIPLLRTDAVEFVSLQRGALPPPGLPDDCPSTVLQTARRIAGLDLVISVDTMVAHLAGALGVPLWLLLKADPDWRWLAGGTGSIWYRNVRKYQQSQPGDWQPPIDRLTADLANSIKAGTLLPETAF